MKIVHTSDLHFGFNNKTCKYLDNFFKDLTCIDFDVMTIAGDIKSHNADQIQKCFRLLRKYIDKPVIAVEGNHDYWDKGEKFHTLEELMEYNIAVAKDFGIVILRGNEYFYKEDDIMFCGFGGWYSNVKPMTNDSYFIPKLNNSYLSCHEVLNDIAHQELNRIIVNKLYGFKKYICITHFCPYIPDSNLWESMAGNSKYLDIITENFDYLLTGHSHQEMDIEINDCRIINSGSDYNRPTYKLIEV